MWCSLWVKYIYVVFSMGEVYICGVLYGLRWPGRSRSRAMSFERFRRCAQDTKAVKLRAMMQLALQP